jgi:signal transduction histidine kinase
LRVFHSNRFWHFPEAADASERREQAIATARVFLAACALLYAYSRLVPVFPIQNSVPITYLLAVYLVLSVVLWLTLRYKPTSDFSIRITAHAADLLCTTALTVLSRGPESPFFLFFVFVLLAAAYRWGLAGTMYTAGAGVALLATEAYSLTPASLPALLSRRWGIPMEPPFEIGQLALRCAYLLIVGLLLGYLAEREKALQSEAAATAQIVAKAHVGEGLKKTLEGMCDQLLAAFRARQAIFSAEDVETGRMFLWKASRTGSPRPLVLGIEEIAPKEQRAYRCTKDAKGWFAWKTRSGKFHRATLMRETSQPPVPSNPVPAALSGFRSVLAVPFWLGSQWKGWVWLPDAGKRLGWRKQLRLLHRVVDAAAPAAYNSYLLSRIRWQIGAQERARLARDLHDGAIQSLLSAELQVHALRRRADAVPADRQAPLDGVENLIHDQVMNLRELMERIRPIDLDPGALPEYLAEQVEKFQRETGIEAEFASDESSPRLTGRGCRELIRIVQELLFNVRRHSGAKHVEVRLSSQDGICRLEVADDGRGFDFEGQFDQAALDASRKGPRVVQERLRLLGGNLEIESHPGRGARLEIKVPQREE